MAKEKAGKVVAVQAKAGLPVSVADELRREREGIKQRVGAVGGGDTIRITQDKKFALPDGTTNEGPLSVVVLDFTAANFYYDRPFRKGDESPPACFAIGPNPKALVPSENSPVKQAEDCNDCPLKEWGTKGEGKACDDLRFLAVREASANPDAKVMLIKVSKTAAKAWDAYVTTLDKQFEGVPIEFVTEIYFDPNVDYASLRFGNPARNPNVNVHFGQRAAAKARLAAEPDVAKYKPLVQKGKVGNKPAAIKR